MCEACESTRALLESGRRRRLWEITGGWHCSILGTCLTLSDLRALGRKLSLRVRGDLPIDYQFHGFFVKEAAKGERPAKLLHKLLDKRHAAAIRKLKDAKTPEELEKHWTAAREAGNIPGAYWAILSHRVEARDLRERMFADVHMLSHLVGASNRADIRRLGALEEQVAALEEKLSKQHRRHFQRAEEKNVEIARLRAQLNVAVIRERRIAAPAAAAVAPKPEGAEKEAQRERALVELSERAQRQQNRIEELRQQLALLRSENQSLETTLTNIAAMDTACPFDLEGRCLLYVGGRQQTVHRLRALVEEWNGEFLHHDGGIERSLSALARAVSRADAVVFPTDCVSRGAALKVKRLCDQSMKPYVPLRTSGIASFVNVLRDGLDIPESAQKAG